MQDREQLVVGPDLVVPRPDALMIGGAWRASATAVRTEVISPATMEAF